MAVVWVWQSSLRRRGAALVWGVMTYARARTKREEGREETENMKHFKSTYTYKRAQIENRYTKH